MCIILNTWKIRKSNCIWCEKQIRAGEMFAHLNSVFTTLHNNIIIHLDVCYNFLRKCDRGNLNVKCTLIAFVIHFS